MTFAAFERRARELWEEIPQGYKLGIDGLVVLDERKPHPELPAIYTLGECLTETYLSDYGGPDSTRSIVALYHGSFQAVSRRDAEFDWEAEIWETLTHELQHHLESLAAESGLEDFDYAADEHFKRLEGESFEPFFFRAGLPLGRGAYRVDRDTYIEIEYPGNAAPARAQFEWRGRRYTASLPERLGDVCFVWIDDGIDPDPGELYLVLVRKPGMGATLRGLLRPTGLEVVEAEAAASPTG
ncbi:MAG: metallopeptidase family protein [Longimicrobiales bacterium]